MLDEAIDENFNNVHVQFTEYTWPFTEALGRYLGTSKPGNAPHEGPRIPAGAQVIDLYSSDDEQSPESGQAETNQKLYSGSPDTTVTTLMGQGVLLKAEKDSRYCYIYVLFGVFCFLLQYPTPSWQEFQRIAMTITGC
jgi:hypothetical protein